MFEVAAERQARARRRVLFCLFCASLAAAAEAQTDTDAPLSVVTVYADRQAKDPGAQSLLTRDTIEDTAATRPAELLNQAPGVNIQMNSGQEHLIAIRSPVLTGGAGQGSFLILENGVPTRSPAFGNVNALIEPHLEAAEAIEIIRGPGSARYGSNAVHGLINVILPEPSENGAGQVSAGLSSLNSLKADASATLGGWHIALSGLDDRGWRDATGSAQQKFSVTGQIEAADWTLRPWISASNLEQETAGFIQGRDAYKNRDLARSNPNPEAFRDAWSARAAMRVERAFGDSDFSVTPYLHSQAMIFSQHFLPFGGVEKNGHTGGGVMARFDRPLGSSTIWRIGADVDVARGYLKELQPLPNPNPAFPRGAHYDYSVDTTSLAVWSELDWALTDQLRLLAGLRAETHDYAYRTRLAPGLRGRFKITPDRDDSFDAITPKLGLVWDVNDASAIYVNYAQGARAPQASDLYRLQNLQQPGEIKTETIESLELGWRGGAFGDRLRADAAVYWMDKQNFFFRDSDGLNVVNGSTEHIGAEVAFAFNVTARMSLTGNAAWSDQTYTFDRPVRAGLESIRRGNTIDTAPEWMGDLSLDWTGEVFRFALSTEYMGEYFTDPANTFVYPGHTVLGARASFDIAPQTELTLILRNLTDEVYADRADVAFGNERYFPGEPLNATLMLKQTF